MVVLARVLVAEPTIIKQEEVDAQVLCLAEKLHKLLLVEVEVSVLPVVEKRHSVILSLVKLVVHHPTLEATTSFASSFGKREEEISRSKSLALRQKIGRSIVIDAAHDSKNMLIVHFEGEAEVACPA